MAKEITEEMSALVDEIVRSAEEGTAPPDINQCLQVAVDVAEWKRVVREKSVVQGTLYIPAIIKKLGEQAVKDGDVSAARLLLDYMEMMPSKGGGGVTVATQINISPQELEEIKREIEAE